MIACNENNSNENNSDDNENNSDNNENDDNENNSNNNENNSNMTKARKLMNNWPRQLPSKRFPIHRPSNASAAAAVFPPIQSNVAPNVVQPTVLPMQSRVATNAVVEPTPQPLQPNVSTIYQSVGPSWERCTGTSVPGHCMGCCAFVHAGWCTHIDELNSSSSSPCLIGMLALVIIVYFI